MKFQNWAGVNKNDKFLAMEVNADYQDNMQDATDSGSFDKAFGAARKSGAKTFTYKGKSFTTKLEK